MTFSIVIPAYNAAATIAATVQSCLNQTVATLEIIVVDDASTDNTIEQLKPYLNHVILIRQPKNRGVSAARNAGWAAASGDYILFIDSDDLFHPQKIEVLSRVFAQNPDVLFLHHPYTLQSFEPVASNVDFKPNKKPFASLLLRNTVASPCMCIARSIATRFDESYRYCEDHEFVLRATHKYGCHYISPILSRLDHAVLSGKGLSAQRWKMRKGELRMYANVWRYNLLLAPLIPFLLVFSLLKHVKAYFL